MFSYTNITIRDVATPTHLSVNLCCGPARGIRQGRSGVLKKLPKLLRIIGKRKKTSRERGIEHAKSAPIGDMDVWSCVISLLH